MSIGSTVKRLRREKNLTQEQLAEYLGVTSRAVSQWECDRTAPDIALIPPLCHVFGVSSDVLLGIDVEKANEEIETVLSDDVELDRRGKRAERISLLREANRKYPRDYRIMLRLSDALLNELSRNGSRDYEEVFGLCNRILSECTDSATRYDATETLAVAYGYAGKKEEMLKLAEEMPHAHFSYENFMTYRWTGSADLAKRQSYLGFLLHGLLSTILCLAGHRGDDGTPIFSQKERTALLKLVPDLLKTLFPDGDYRYFAQYAETGSLCSVADALKEKDLETAWRSLDQAAFFSVCFDTYDPDAPHTSPVLRGFSSEGWIPEAEGNHSAQLLAKMTTDEKIAPLRSNPRFDELVKRLRKVADKP